MLISRCVTVAVTVGLLAGAVCGEGVLSGDHELFVFMHDALARAELEVEFPVRDGKVGDHGYGCALNYNKADHDVTVTKRTVTADAITLELAIRLNPDPWVRGGQAESTLTLRKGADGLTGTHETTFRDKTSRGKVDVTLRRPLTASKPNFRPLQKEEHPRLTGRDPNWKRPANPKPTRRGTEALRRVLTSPGSRLAVERGESVAKYVMLYDRYYWEADEGLRKAATEAMVRYAQMLIHGGGPGWNPSPWSNWQGRWRGAAGLAALAVLGHPGSFPLAPARANVDEVPVAKIDWPRRLPITEVDASRSDADYRVGTHWWQAGPFPHDKRVDFSDVVKKISANPPGANEKFDVFGREMTFSGVKMGRDDVYLDLTDAFKGSDDQAIFLFTVLEVERAHAAVVLLRGAKHVWLGGKELKDHQTIGLDAGRYPLVAMVSNAGYPSWIPHRKWRIPEFRQVRDPRAELQRWRERYKQWKDSGDGTIPEAPRLLKLAEVNCRRYMRTALGDAGFNHEGEGYTSHTMEMITHFSRAYYDCTGINIMSGTGADWLPLRYKAIDVRGLDNRGGYGRRGFWPARGVIPLMPPELREGLQATTPAEFPGHCVRDKQKASYVFRNRWKNADDIYVIIEGKGEQLPASWNDAKAGTFRIYGLGSRWAEHSYYGRGAKREVHNVVLLPSDNTCDRNAGTEAHFQVDRDGSGIVTLDMDEVYLGQGRGKSVDYHGRIVQRNVKDLGIRGKRCFAVDYSGTSGAEAMIVVLDEIRGGGRRVWQMHVPGGVKARATGNGFVLSRGGVSLVGTFISPDGVKVSAGGRVTAESNSGSYWLVMTLQKGDAPKVTVTGKGLDATVTVGGQKVRFDGQKLLLGDSK